MNEPFILKTAFSFREKFSYIIHTEDYKGIAYKLWTICKLITSCGKCDLLITPSKAKAIKDNNGQCIFSRKIAKISDSEGEIQSKFLRYAHENQKNRQSEGEISIEIEESSTSNNINAAQHELIVKEYEELYESALRHINSAECAAYTDTEDVVRDILRSACYNVNINRSQRTKEQISQDRKEILKKNHQDRDDLQGLLEFSDNCMKLAWNLVENNAQIAVSAVPDDSEQESITERRYNFVSDNNENENNQKNIIKKVIWPALHDKSNPKTPIIAKGWAKIVHS